MYLRITPKLSTVGPSQCKRYHIFFLAEGSGSMPTLWMVEMARKD